MKKKILTLLFVLFAVVLLTGCGKEEEKEASDETQRVAGWELNTDVTNTLMRDEEEVFKKATANYSEMTLESIGYLGSQVVAGTNHMFLCKATKEGHTTFKVVVVYEDLNGNAEVKQVNDFVVERYVNKDADGANEELAGGWTASSECGENTLTDEERDMFSKATESLLGVDYKPVEILATQLVSGKNYAVLAVGATVTENPIYNIYVLTIYKDLSGNSKIISVAKLDLSEFNK